MLVAAAMTLPVHAEPLVLRNRYWTVEVDPSTLRLAATPVDGPRIVAPADGHAHRVSGLHYVHDGVGWRWDEGAWQFQVRLQEHEVLLWIRQGEDGEATLRRLTMHSADRTTSPAADDADREDAVPVPLHLGQGDQIELAALHPLAYRRAMRLPAGRATRQPRD